MPTKAQVGALTIIAVGSFFGMIYFVGLPTSMIGWTRPLSAAFSITGISVWLFHVLLWRWSPEWLAPKPNVSGTWMVTADMWPTASRTEGSFTGFMVVRQQYFTLSMRLLTLDTSSELIAEQFVVTKAGAYELWAVYHCEPRAIRRPMTVPQHYGAMRLTRIGTGVSMRLEGHYWVDSSDPNLTDGALRLSDRIAKHFDDYESALAAFSEPRSV